LSVLSSAVHRVKFRPVSKGVLVAGSSLIFRRLVDVILTYLHCCHKVRGDSWNKTQDLFNSMLVYANNDTEVLPVVVRR